MKITAEMLQRAGEIRAACEANPTLQRNLARDAAHKEAISRRARNDEYANAVFRVASNGQGSFEQAEEAFVLAVAEGVPNPEFLAADVVFHAKTYGTGIREAFEFLKNT